MVDLWTVHKRSMNSARLLHMDGSLWPMVVRGASLVSLGTVHGQSAVGTWMVHGGSMDGSRSVHGEFMVGPLWAHGVSVCAWAVHGRSMVISWRSHRNLPVWCFNGSSVGLHSSASVVLLWDFFNGTSLVLLWDSHGAPMVLPWDFHCASTGL